MEARRPLSDPAKLAALVGYATSITSCGSNQEVMRLGVDCVQFIERNPPITLPKTGADRTIVCAARDRLEAAHREPPSKMDQAILACLIGRLYDLDHDRVAALKWYLQAEEYLSGDCPESDVATQWRRYCTGRIRVNPIGSRLIARGDLVL